MQQQWWRIGGERLRKTSEYYRKYHTIQAIPREVSGPQMTARDRAQGRIPAVVFSPTAANTFKQLLTTVTKKIDAILTKLDPSFFFSTTLKLHIRAGYGSSDVLHSGNVLPIKLARNEEIGKVMNLESVWAEEGSKLEVDVPVVFKGVDSCPGLKKGGQLSTVRKNLKYLCPTECIPQKIEVDISNLDIGDQIFMKDIKVDPSLKPLSGNDTKPICKIVASEVENQMHQSQTKKFGSVAEQSQTKKFGSDAEQSQTKKFGSDTEHNRKKRNFYHSVTLLKKRRKRRIKRIELPTHNMEVNHRTLKAVVFYGPKIDHIPHLEISKPCSSKRNASAMYRFLN